MSDFLLLRFRDLNVDVDTITEHNKIADRQAKVLWGWWKKPLELMPDPSLTMFEKDLLAGDARVLFIDSANRKLYRAPIYKVYYHPGGTLQPVPEPELCPEYYRSAELPAWFEIGTIKEVEVGYNFLNNFVFSRNNRTSPTRSTTALLASQIEQVVTDQDFLDSNVSLWFITPLEELGVFERSRVVRPLSHGIWPTKGKYALHISDLHFGENHAFRNQLSTPGGPQIGKESMLEALLQDLETVGIQDNDIALVLVTGDLTWRGDAHEFANAQNFFEELASRLGLHFSQIVNIPGNHDIEWRQGQNDIDPNAELNYANFCRAIYKSEPERSFLRIYRFNIAGRTVCVIALNSCRLESKENAGLGFVGREQLHQMMRFLNDPVGTNELRLALIHHHLMPVNYIEGIDWSTKRVSIMLDAEAVIRSLISVKTQIVLHGHQHQPYFAELTRYIEGYANPYNGRESNLKGKIFIVGGGSIGVARAHLNVIGRNTYNIIDLGHNDYIQVRTRVQSPVGPGFTDSDLVVFHL